jgi:hypothetical protein
VFRRSVLDRIGGFNEALPVLGDWFFNLEFLLEDDIAVLPEPLARYHHRDRGDTNWAAYANSVIGGVSKHEEFAAVARNAFLRRHGDRAGVAASFAMGYAVSDLQGTHRPAQSTNGLAHRTARAGQRRQALVRGGTERRAQPARDLAPHPEDTARPRRYRLGPP